jgi:hypothetical protein
VILTQQTESQLVRNGFPNTTGTRVQKLLYTHSVDYRGGMGIAPRRITATGFETGYIDCVFNSKTQSIQGATADRRQIESRYEGVTLSNGDRGAVHSLTLTQREQSAITLQAMTTSEPSEKEKRRLGSRRSLEPLFSAEHA